MRNMKGGIHEEVDVLEIAGGRAGVHERLIQSKLPARNGADVIMLPGLG